MNEVIRECWIKTEFDLHYFDEINFNEYSRGLGFKRANIHGVFTINKSILVYDPAITAGYMEYKFINKNNIRVKENLSEKKIIKYKEYMRNNPRLFKKLKHISVHKIAIIYKYEKYHNLLFRHNYLQCLTFLLCTKNIFCRDVAKLIVQKIL